MNDEGPLHHPGQLVRPHWTCGTSFALKQSPSHSAVVNVSGATYYRYTAQFVVGVGLGAYRSDDGHLEGMQWWLCIFVTDGTVGWCRDDRVEVV